jgi:transketolase
MRRAFGRAIVEMARANPRLVLLHGDVEQEMGEFKRLFPDRIFNLGLCEQSMISIAAGMACAGLFPVVYSITPFLIERPFEQIKIDIDEQNLPVLLIGYADYPTHGATHRPLDLTIISKAWKNIRAIFPVDGYEVAGEMLIRQTGHHCPAFISLKKETVS